MFKSITFNHFKKSFYQRSKDECGVDMVLFPIIKLAKQNH
jgi:hypothetical protein